MYCHKCGAEFEDNLAECPDCGTPSPVSNQLSAQATVNDGKAYQKQVKENLKHAKAEYKRARKAAGKSRVPLVIFCIVLGVALVAAGAFGAYYVMDQRMNELKNSNTEMKNTLEKLQQEYDAAMAAAAASEQEKNAREAFIGTWGFSSYGKATVNGQADASCAQGKANASNVSVTIKTANSTEIAGSVSVLFHGHATETGGGTGVSNDKVRTFNNVKGVYADGKVTFTIDSTATDTQGVALGDGSKIVVVCTLGGAASTNANGEANANAAAGSNSTMAVAVQSYFQSTVAYVEDTYTLAK